MSEPLTDLKPPQEKLPDITGAGQQPKLPDTASTVPPDSPASAIPPTPPEPSASAVPPAPGPAATPTPPETKLVGVTKPTRRTGTATRKPSEAQAGTKPRSAPPKPDTAKNIAFAICGLLFLAIIGMGIYLLVRPKPVAPAKPPLSNLSPEAKELAEKAQKAEQLYVAGKDEAAESLKLEDASKKLEGLRSADEKLLEANKLFNEIVDQNQTVEGFKKQIELARDKKLSIDKELAPIQIAIDKLEGEERVQKSKAAQATKPDSPNPTPAPEVAKKEDAEPDLSDAHIKDLIDRDPSEAEKLIKLRQKKDPTYKPPSIP